MGLSLINQYGSDGEKSTIPCENHNEQKENIEQPFINNQNYYTNVNFVSNNHISATKPSHNTNWITVNSFNGQAIIQQNLNAHNGSTLDSITKDILREN